MQSQLEGHFTKQGKKHKMPQNAVIYIPHKLTFAQNQPLDESKIQKQIERKTCERNVCENQQMLNEHVSKELKGKLDNEVASNIPFLGQHSYSNQKSDKCKKNEYKKLLNRKAAANYRRKKVIQEERMKSEFQILEDHNIYLKGKISRLKSEICTMKRLSLASKLRTIQPVNEELSISPDFVPAPKNSLQSALKFQDAIIHNDYSKLPEQNEIIKNTQNTTYTVHNKYTKPKHMDGSKELQVRVPVIQYSQSELNDSPKSPDVSIPDTMCIKQEIQEEEDYILPHVSPCAYEEKRNDFLGNMIPVKHPLKRNQEKNHIHNNFIIPNHQKTHTEVVQIEESAINLSRSSLKSSEVIVPDSTYVEENPQKQTIISKVDSPPCTNNDGHGEISTLHIPVIKSENTEFSSSSNSCDTQVSLTNSAFSTSDERSFLSNNHYQWTSDESSIPTDCQATYDEETADEENFEKNSADKHYTNSVLPNSPHISEELKIKLKTKVQQINSKTASLNNNSSANTSAVSLNNFLCTNKSHKKYKDPDHIKLKNRKASIRYRQRKQEKQKALQNELNSLEVLNLCLKEKAKSLQSEIYTLMGIGAAAQFRSANSRAVTETRLPPHSYEEKIRMQNRKATARYRLKISAKKKHMENEINMLEKRNKELKSKVNHLNDRISQLKKIFKDFIINSRPAVGS